MTTDDTTTVDEKTKAIQEKLDVFGKNFKTFDVDAMKTHKQNIQKNNVERIMEATKQANLDKIALENDQNIES